MPRVVHFEISADDPDRAGRFYREVFGWRIEKWAGPIDYWLATTGEGSEPGIDGGIVQRVAGRPPVVNTIAVPSVDEYVDKVQAAGGEVVAPKIAVPGVGWQAYCTDTEGNLLGVHEQDPSAK